MGLQEIVCEDMGWIDLHQDRVQLVVNFCETAMNRRFR